MRLGTKVLWLLYTAPDGNKSGVLAAQIKVGSHDARHHVINTDVPGIEGMERALRQCVEEAESAVCRQQKPEESIE